MEDEELVIGNMDKMEQRLGSVRADQGRKIRALHEENGVQNNLRILKMMSN
jgi:hypothetical protein